MTNRTIASDAGWRVRAVDTAKLVRIQYSVPLGTYAFIFFD